jgi:hypothetical protein
LLDYFNNQGDQDDEYLPVTAPHRAEPVCFAAPEIARSGMQLA